MQPRPPSSITYTPTRRTQPYRAQGPARHPSAALDAMTAGRTLFGQNPMDLQRAFASARPGSLWWHILGLSSPSRTMHK